MHTARERLSLDGTWSFLFDPAGSPADRNTPPDVTKSGWRSVVVPAPWQAQFEDLRERGGVAWYWRTFETPPAWTGEESILLHFGATDYHARVWLNGVFLGDHEGGYLPFEFEVGSMLQPTNDLIVEVIDPSDDPQRYLDFPLVEIPHGKQSWYGQSSGIWQPVWLERRPAFHIRAVRLTPDLHTGQVQAHLRFSRPADNPGAASVEVRGPDGATVVGSRVPIPARATDMDLTVIVDQPLAWSPDHPHLYTFETHLPNIDGRKDVHRERFGFRTIETRNGRLILNGKVSYLRGALDQGYYPDTIYTPPSVDFLEDQFRKAKAMGLNLLRCHAKIPDPRYYEVADRMGMLIWTELPNWHLFTERAAERGRATLQGILERDGNHPSIIAWTIVNEDWGTDLVHDATHRAWLRETYQWLKELDPTRLIVDNSPCWPNFHLETDVEDYHHYRAIPDHRREWDEFVNAFASRPDWTFAPGGDAVRSGDEPLVVSEFGNWGLPDVDLLLDADGREPWWFETGLEWGEGVAYPHGVRRRFNTWRLDRVFGSWPDFVEATQWQQFRALKYQIESMRRQSNIAGYVITELTDVYWECNGLLDMRRNPKVFCADLVALNANTVVIPEWERVAYWAGEPVRVGISVAHGAGPGIDDSEMSWTLSPSTAANRAAVPDLNPGQVKTIGTAAFTAPAVATPRVERLDLELRATNGLPLASSHLELTIFPQRRGPVDAETPLCVPDQDLAERLTTLGYSVTPDPQAARAIVADRLNEALISYVRAGGRLLLLVDRPEAIGSGFAGVRIETRDGLPWDGDWISSFAWLRREGPFERLPGGPLLDHGFDRVIPECALIGFHPWDFEAHVHAGLFVGWIHKPVALIAERRYGKGRAVVTTFRLTTDPPGVDPTATTLLDALIELTLGT
ncbi:MAG: glycoside hydrolase family 2 TIM barrel-domain containing protein [Anaerolineae bacterium]|jgi:hypothetical protein